MTSLPSSIIDTPIGKVRCVMLDAETAQVTAGTFREDDPPALRINGVEYEVVLMMHLVDAWTVEHQLGAPAGTRVWSWRKPDGSAGERRWERKGEWGNAARPTDAARRRFNQEFYPAVQAWLKANADTRGGALHAAQVKADQASRALVEAARTLEAAQEGYALAVAALYRLENEDAVRTGIDAIDQGD